MNPPDETELPSPHPSPGVSSSPAAAPEPTVADLQRSLSALQRLFHLTLAALVVLIVGLDFYVLIQIRGVRRQNYGMTRQIADMRQMVGEYETNNVPVMNRFLADLQRFAETHPDFAASSRFSRPGMPLASNAPPVAPAVPVPPKKK